jgi:alkanesulfonate monooxygenase SsuD/methylene tetrahydromethanopterin reductase-like flavin-dependent oxidoreductase (luciferase family)
MITKFDSSYYGTADMENLGYTGTPINERCYSKEQLAKAMHKVVDYAKCMDERGYNTFWMAEHHFQPEGTELIPNLLMMAMHLCGVTKNLRIGCGFNIVPMWHPLRLAEDYAMADILTGGRVIFGVGRGYHTREVETFGSPMLDADANRALFEEQVDIVMKAFRSESFSHQGRHYTLPPAVPYRGYELKELTLVPRPLRQPVECWQPIVSAGARGLDFMIKHRIRGMIGGGAATMASRSIYAYQEAAQRAGLDYRLGEGLSLGIFYHLAESRERAVREITPWYEEHVKMFGPLGFVPGMTPEQNRAAMRRGGWDAAGVPRLEDYTKVGAWFAGPPEELAAYLKSLEQQFPGLEYIHVSNSMGTPQTAMVEQLAWFAKEVMPAFVSRA